METKQRGCGLILVECDFMYKESKSRILHAIKEVREKRDFHTRGYEDKRWEERNPDVIKKLLEAERHLTDAFYLIEELTYHEQETN